MAFTGQIFPVKGSDGISYCDYPKCNKLAHHKVYVDKDEAGYMYDFACSVHIEEVKKQVIRERG